MDRYDDMRCVRLGTVPGHQYGRHRQYVEGYAVSERCESAGQAWLYRTGDRGVTFRRKPGKRSVAGWSDRSLCAGPECIGDLYPLPRDIAHSRLSGNDAQAPLAFLAANVVLGGCFDVDVYACGAKAERSVRVFVLPVLGRVKP